MSAARVALGAGTITNIAVAATITTNPACKRGSRVASDAIAAAIHPSTARLNPEIARMCDRPTTRNEPSIAAYPSSDTPSTSATSIARMPFVPSSGTPETIAAWTRSRSAARTAITERLSDLG
ncbi:MAG: hypothetical protein LW636_04715 [Planctomycetaceae bacterium]|nr:hypothetical protein [Planctomycetaceae bacterium]